MKNSVKATVISNMAELNLSTANDVITTKQFVTLVLISIKGNTASILECGYMDYALHRCIIEDYDMTNMNSPIERRSAARIVHEALLTELKEKDDVKWSAAENLNDLYACHTCVIHIAQVYVKGIMTERDNNMFDVRGSITCTEALEIVVRMLDKEQRIPQTEGRTFESKSLSPNEAWELMSNDRRAILIDVRTKEEYNIGHIPRSICIPLNEILNNPFSVCENKDTPIILYCQKGYKSSAAAQALIDVGYKRIYTIPGIAQYQYNIIAK